MTWTIDNTHTHLGFSVKHMMVTTVRGQFRSYRGTVNLDTEDFTKSSFEGEIDVASIDTGVEQRDNHLRSNDFFDAPNQPVIKYKSRSIEAIAGGNFAVYGDITIRGVTKPLKLEVEYLGTSKNPYGKIVAGFSATGSLNRKDFGVSFNTLLETGGVAVGENVKLEVEAELVEAAVSVAA